MHEVSRMKVVVNLRVAQLPMKGAQYKAQGSRSHA